MRKDVVHGPRDRDAQGPEPVQLGGEIGDPRRGVGVIGGLVEDAVEPVKVEHDPGARDLRDGQEAGDVSGSSNGHGGHAAFERPRVEERKERAREGRVVAQEDGLRVARRLEGTQRRGGVERHVIQAPEGGAQIEQHVPTSAGSRADAPEGADHGDRLVSP